MLINNVGGQLQPVNIFIVAMNDQADYSARATANGLDHLFAWHNDRELYNRTLDHSEAGGHPCW